jgi:uncharacterized membrane protein YuzA (DUF378 family)
VAHPDVNLARCLLRVHRSAVVIPGISISWCIGGDSLGSENVSMWLIDFPTLVLIIVGGLDLGVLGFFGYDAATAVFGPHARIFYMAVGISAVWQLMRQRFH